MLQNKTVVGDICLRIVTNFYLLISFFIMNTYLRTPTDICSERHVTPCIGLTFIIPNYSTGPKSSRNKPNFKKETGHRLHKKITAFPIQIILICVEHSCYKISLSIIHIM